MRWCRTQIEEDEDGKGTRVSCNEEIVSDFDEGGLCAVTGAETGLERLVE